MSRRIDPRVFAPNFAMQPDPQVAEPMGTEAPELSQIPAPLDPASFTDAPPIEEPLADDRQGEPAPVSPVPSPQDPGDSDGRGEPWEMVSTPEGGGESNTEARPLEPFVYGGKIRVAPGYIRNPYTIPTIGGTAVDDATPPELTPASGTSYLYLKLTFDPVTVELDSGFYAMGFAIDTIDAAEFVLDASLAPSGATDPVIDSSDGSITTAGVAFVLWAEVENDGGLVSIVYGSGTGHASLLFHPPDQLVVFQS